MRFCCIAQGTITSDGTRWRIMWKKKKKSNPGSLLGYFAVQQKLIEHCELSTVEKIKILKSTWIKDLSVRTNTIKT